MKKTGILSTILASLVMLLVVINILMLLGNQSIQTEVSDRQQYIAQALQLENLNRQVVTVLANLAMKTNDDQLKKLLASSGVDLNVGPEATGGSK